MQGNWQREPFDERKYDPMTGNVICSGLSKIDEQSAKYELKTTLPDSFVGLCYSYNDTGQSEGWMQSVVDETSGGSKRKPKKEADNYEQKAAKALAENDGVVRAQVLSTMRQLLISVQDRVLTERGVLKQPELKVANWKDKELELASSTSDPVNPVSSMLVPSKSEPDLIEQFVWGMDCYTRRNVMICIEKDLDTETAVEFIEKWLLPAINAVPPDLAHDLTVATRILEGLPIGISDGDDTSNDKAGDSKDANEENGSRNDPWSHSLIGKALLHRIRYFSAPWLGAAAYQLRRAIEALGQDFFRVHPKGQGSIVLKPRINANTLVTFYRGEIYPSWRWGEKMDAIDLTQQHIGLRPNLPDFYNMVSCRML